MLTIFMNFGQLCWLDFVGHFWREIEIYCTLGLWILTPFGWGTPCGMSSHRDGLQIWIAKQHSEEKMFAAWITIPLGVGAMVKLHNSSFPWPTLALWHIPRWQSEPPFLELHCKLPAMTSSCSYTVDQFIALKCGGTKHQRVNSGNLTSEINE